jgi:hypothetical protein
MTNELSFVVVSCLILLSVIGFVIFHRVTQWYSTQENSLHIEVKEIMDDFIGDINKIIKNLDMRLL